MGRALLPSLARGVALSVRAASSAGEDPSNAGPGRG